MVIWINFPGNNYSKLILTTDYSTTEIDLTKNEEWIGILIPINTTYRIILKNGTDDLILKVIFNKYCKRTEYIDTFKDESFSTNYLDNGGSDY